MSERPLVTRVFPVAACGAIGLLSSAFLIGSTPDEEEFRFAILTSWLHVRGLMHGSYDFWTSSLGLGIPLPLTPNFLFHPLLPLLALVTPATWARGLLLVHTVLGASGMWQLARTIGLRAPTRAVCVATFLLATPAQNYILSDFWPSHYVVWTSMPWLVLIAWRVLDSDGPKERRQGVPADLEERRQGVPADSALRWWSVALGLCSGLVIANTNPGHVIVYITLAVGIAVAHMRRLLARWRWIVVAAAIAVAIASPNLVQLARERPLFGDLSVANVLDPLPLRATWNVVFSPIAAPARWQLPENIPHTRTLSFGGPFAVLAAIGGLLFVRRRLDLALMLAMSTLLLFTSMMPLSLASARFHYRDPLTLAAIPLAGLVVDRLLTRRATATAAVILLTAQAATVVVAAWPALRRTWEPESREAAWFRGATGDRDAVDRLLQLMPTGGRLAYAPALDHDVYEKGRLRDGIGTNALAYRGASIVNGWFKGVSTAPIWPDERMFYARTRVPQPLIESNAALDVLGVRYVLANAGETVADGLRERGTVPLSNDSHLTLYENSDAWADAFVTKADTERIDLPVLEGCGTHSLLCRDFTPIVGTRSPERVLVSHRDGSLDVRLFSAETSRLLIVTQMFRPDWIATSEGERLETVPVFGALLGVRVPPGVTSVSLRYRPMTLIAATVLAWAVVATSVAFLATRRHDRRAEQR